jgi:hypothetical protein
MSKFAPCRRFVAGIFGALSMIGIALADLALAQNTPRDPPAGKHKLDVAAIYFPSWHSDDHYSSWYGENWNEWQLLRENPERFPGHNRIKPTDEWGYFDEANPQCMAKQIDLAVDHGIDAFVFDWYWYSGVQILHRPVEETLPKTPNKDKIKYALMWADHTWVNYFPFPYEKPVNWLLPLRHSPANFDRAMRHCIDKHFNQSNYWKVNGGLYFALFAPEDFIEQLGGPEKTKAVLDAAREKVRRAGLGEMHFAAFTGIPQSIPSIKQAGFDSMTSYNVTTMSSGRRLPEQPFEEYDAMVRRHESHWDNMDNGELPYGPVVTVGWDVTPRWEKDVPWPPQKNHYPYTPTVIDNTPEKFGDLLRRALKHCDESKLRPPALFVNSWNEWTEGSALLPQRKYGDGYLKQLKKALEEKKKEANP